MAKAAGKKICIVVSSLGVGGAERSSAMLSELLFDLGYDIHVVTVLDKIEYPYRGKLLNLGKLKSKDDSSLGRLKRLGVFKKYLRENNFDYVIDNRTRIGFLKEFIISRLIYNPKKTIYCVRSFKTDGYINSNRVLGRYLYSSAHKIVAVSKAISRKLKSRYGFKNLIVIHNSVKKTDIKTITEQKVQGNYILFYGRLNDSVKNISLLLDAYSKSELPTKNIKLKILGSGEDKVALKNASVRLGLSDWVEFYDYQSDPYDMVKASLFTVLTSRYEGFPRVLIESLALEVPVISVDCKSGPNEIVIDEHNGLLVENHNAEVLAKAMNRLLEDKKLYLHCKTNAKESIQKFSEAAIGLKWQSVLN